MALRHGLEQGKEAAHDVRDRVLLEPVLRGRCREARLAHDPVADRNAGHVLADLGHRADDVWYALVTCCPSTETRLIRSEVLKNTRGGEL